MKLKHKDSAYISMNLFWSVLIIAINSIVHFTLTPYITKLIGIEAYGFVALSNSVMGYIDIVAVAINAYASRFISVSYHKKKFDEANKFLNSAIFANFVLSVCIIVPGSIALYYISDIVNISQNIVDDVRILFALVFVNYIATLILAIFNVGTFINNRLDLTSKQKTFAALIKAGVLLSLCVFLKPHVWYIALSTLVSTLYVLIKNRYYMQTLTPELALSFWNIDFKAINKLVSAGVWNSINNLGNSLNTGLDLLIANLLLGPIQMGQVSIGKEIATILSTFVVAVCSTFQPKQLRLYAGNRIKDLISEIKNSIRFTAAFGNVVVACIIFCGKDFLRCWLGDRSDLEVLYNLLLMIVLAEVIAYTVRPLNYVFVLTTKLKFASVLTIVEGALNVLLMILLIHNTHIGVYAITLSTFLLHNIMLFFCIPIYSCKLLKTGKTTFYPAIIRMICALIINCFVLWIIVTVLCNLFSESLSSLIVLACICAFISLTIQFVFALTNNEKKLVFEKISEFVSKSHK